MHPRTSPTWLRWPTLDTQRPQQTQVWPTVVLNGSFVTLSHIFKSSFLCPAWLSRDVLQENC
uniref:Uncharacterized protein n=1 Tax=Anguilla anguilla TaxID=7936 RepID=A0A0E9WWM5_ANGAN